MNEIAPKTDIQKSNIENEDLIGGKGILLGFLVSMPIWLIIIIIIMAFRRSFSPYPNESPILILSQFNKYGMIKDFWVKFSPKVLINNITVCWRARCLIHREGVAHREPPLF